MKKRVKRVIPVKSRSSEREVQRGRVHSSLTGGREGGMLIQTRLFPSAHPHPPLPTGVPRDEGQLGPVKHCKIS